MLQIILQYFSSVLPHTSARLAHWHLLFYDINHETLIFSLLPLCIYFIEGFAAARHFRDDDNGEGPPEDRPGPFRVINDGIKYWFLVYKVLDLAAALDLVMKTSGFYGKAWLAIDLFVESTLLLLAKTLFFVSVGLFVGAALEGFPYLEGFFFSLWTFVQLFILDIQDLLEEPFGRNDVAADAPFGDE